MKLPVLILAGSREGEHEVLAKFGGVIHKALLPILGTSMIERVVLSLEKAPSIGKIWVSTENPTSLSFLKDRVQIIKAAASPSESVIQALEHIETPFLITTADHALLKSEWIEEFLQKSKQCHADLTAAVASDICVKRDVPTTKRTFIKLSDLTFSGCNLFWIKNHNAKSVIFLWKTLQNNRKHPLRMAWTLGFLPLLQFISHRLSRKKLENRIHALTGAKVCLIPLDDGKASVDVDKVSDFHLVEKILKEQRI